MKNGAMHIVEIYMKGANDKQAEIKILHSFGHEESINPSVKYTD